MEFTDIAFSKEAIDELSAHLGITDKPDRLFGARGYFLSDAPLGKLHEGLYETLLTDPHVVYQEASADPEHPLHLLKECETCAASRQSEPHIRCAVEDKVSDMCTGKTGKLTLVDFNGSYLFQVLVVLHKLAHTDRFTSIDIHSIDDRWGPSIFTEEQASVAVEVESEGLASFGREKSAQMARIKAFLSAFRSLHPRVTLTLTIYPHPFEFGMRRFARQVPEPDILTAVDYADEIDCLRKFPTLDLMVLLCFCGAHTTMVGLFSPFELRVWSQQVLPGREKEALVALASSGTVLEQCFSKPQDIPFKTSTGGGCVVS